MQADVVLTVSESKRLIARAVSGLSCVRKALKDGLVVIATGTTTSYVAEEILGRPLEKRRYVTGYTPPATMDPGLRLPEDRLPDIVLRNGEVVEGITRSEGARQFQPGDVFIKGGNALNYDRKIVGIAIGGGEGGTMGSNLGPIIGHRATLVLPIGLEKLVAHDIMETVRIFGEADKQLNDVPQLFPATGEIVTEIEALDLLAGVRAIHVGSGGILSAEGAVRLLLRGDREAVARAMEIVGAIQGEPAFR